MAAAENSVSDSNILVMGDDIQGDTVHDSSDELKGGYKTVEYKTKISGYETGIQASVGSRGVSDYNPIDIIVECTQYDESLQECIDRMDSEEANFQIGLANAILNVQHTFIKEQTDAFYNIVSSSTTDIWGSLERLEKNFRASESYVKDWGVRDTNGPFLNSLKFMLYSIYDTISINTDEIREAIEGEFETSGSYVSDWSRSSSDGNFSKSLEWQNYQIFNAVNGITDKIEDMFYTTSTTAYVTSWDSSSSDSPIARTQKWMLRSINGNITRTQDAMTNLFGVGQSTTDYESFEYDSADSAHTRMTKWQNKTINNNIKAIPKAISDLWYWDTSWDVAGTLTVGSSDTPLVKFWKQSLSVLNKSIKGISASGGGDPDEMFKVFKDSLEDFQSSFDKMVKYLKNFEFTGEAGTNLWDVLETMIKSLGDGFGDLADLFGDLLDFTENIMDMFIEVFVPKENVIKDGFEGLQEVVGAKFKAMSTLKNVMETTFTQPQREFENIQVALPKYGTVTIMESSWVNAALPVTRNLIGGIMMLVTSVWAYRKITTELIT